MRHTMPKMMLIWGRSIVSISQPPRPHAGDILPLAGSGEGPIKLSPRWTSGNILLQYTVVVFSPWKLRPFPVMCSHVPLTSASLCIPLSYQSHGSSPFKQSLWSFSEFGRTAAAGKQESRNPFSVSYWSPCNERFISFLLFSITLCTCQTQTGLWHCSAAGRTLACGLLWYSLLSPISLVTDPRRINSGHFTRCGPERDHHPRPFAMCLPLLFYRQADLKEKLLQSWKGFFHGPHSALQHFKEIKSLAFLIMIWSHTYGNTAPK